jgi:hypothetical protein
LIVNAQQFLLAFGFSNLAMLGWLAAAAAPLLIHLWSRHRFREAPWAAMQFLLAALRKNSRRLQIQQWLLLALRTLLIAMVVLAVAEPFGENLAAGRGSAPAHYVLVIDGSFSMAYRDGETSCFDRARSLAADLVRNSRAGDSFTVMLMGTPPKTIVGRETVDHAAIVSQIESLTQTHTRADLTATLEIVDTAFADIAKAARAPKRHEVYFFTDLQQSTWQDVDSDRTQANEAASQARPADTQINARLSALAERAAVEVIDLGQPGASNLAVTRVAPSEPFVTVGQEIGIAATLQQFGQQPRLACRVELLVDDVPVAQQTVDVLAGGEANVQFSYRFNSPGEHTVEMRAEDDRLKMDDSRWLVVPVREEIRVLCVAGHEGAAKYVADALNPNAQPQSAIKPTVVSDGQLAEMELAEFDCIFMCNVAQLAATEGQRLTRYVEAGGGIVFFLGDRIDPASYNALAPSHPGNEPAQPLLPARVGDLVSDPQFGIVPLDYRHPIVGPFRGRERAGLLTTPVSRYFQLDLSQSSSEAQVAVATRSGDPLIVTAPLGRGRIAVVATDGSLSSIDPATGEPWTLWPTWPSFLPIVRELLANIGGGDGQMREQTVGATLHGSIAVTLSSVAANEPLQITCPDGRTALASTQTTTSGVEWSFDDTDVSGVYSLRGLPEFKLRQYAVNVDTIESDLARIQPDDLPANVIVETTMQNATGDIGTSDRYSRAGWSQPLLWTALAIMFLESLVAWRFGRGGA